MNEEQPSPIIRRDPLESPITHLANQITRQILELAALKAENAVIKNQNKHLMEAAVVSRQKAGALQDQIDALQNDRKDCSIEQPRQGVVGGDQPKS